MDLPNKLYNAQPKRLFCTCDDYDQAECPCELI